MSIRQFNKQPVWTPDEHSGKKMKAFIKTVENKYNVKFSDYWNFHRWTTENISEFWAEIWDFIGVIYSKSYDQVVDLRIPMEDSPKWFEGARLNYAENLLKFRDDRTALIITGEDREVERLSFQQMYEETRVYAAALRKIGLQKGDRVACYMSNRKEALIAMLAVTGIGAIWTGCLPIIRSQGYLSRLKQVHPKILFTVDQFSYNTQTIHLLKNIKEITEGLPSLEKVIIVPSRSESKLKCISDIRNSCFLDDFLKTAHNEDGTVPEMVFEQVSFSHPVFISYTSGTTGLPKTIVHGFGVLLAGMRDFLLHLDCTQEDLWLAVSPVGWGSWNVANHLLPIGATLVLYEGVPYFLSPTYLWDLIDDLKITRIFLMPSVMDEMDARKYFPTERHHLSSLHSVMCGGNVVKPRNFEFPLKLKKGVRLVAVYAVTETISLCIACDSTIPLHTEEISSPCLGICLECLDDQGNPILGEMGELVISKPVPSFPLGFWGDTSGDRLKKSYFSKYPGKFAIGDSIIINPITKGIIVCGRSDETINQSEYRFGSSEIYNVVQMFPEIRDCLCVGHYSEERGERAVLFILMEEGHLFNEVLVHKLRKRIAEELTFGHVPGIFLEAPGIPYNANGKKMELIVKKIINKMPHDPETVANFECLKFYYDIPEFKEMPQ